MNARMTVVWYSFLISFKYILLREVVTINHRHFLLTEGPEKLNVHCYEVEMVTLLISWRREH